MDHVDDGGTGVCGQSGERGNDMFLVLARVDGVVDKSVADSVALHQGRGDWRLDVLWSHRSRSPSSDPHDCSLPYSSPRASHLAACHDIALFPLLFIFMSSSFPYDLLFPSPPSPFPYIPYKEGNGHVFPISVVVYSHNSLTFPCF